MAEWGREGRSFYQMQPLHLWIGLGERETEEGREKMMSTVRKMERDIQWENALRQREQEGEMDGGEGWGRGWKREADDKQAHYSQLNVSCWTERENPRLAEGVPAGHEHRAAGILTEAWVMPALQTPWNTIIRHPIIVINESYGFTLDGPPAPDLVSGFSLSPSSLNFSDAGFHKRSQPICVTCDLLHVWSLALLFLVWFDIIPSVEGLCIIDAMNKYTN